MRTIACPILIAVLASCSDVPMATPPLEALTELAPNARYEITKFSSGLGGTVSRGTAINSRGWVAGFSSLPGNTTRHAALWRDGAIVDLGTLGGPNSSVVWPGLNDLGMVVGIAETADLDPLGEQWSCTAFLPALTGHLCRGFVWQGGMMRALPTLGGNQGFATGVNNRGQVVGWAETPVHDPTCNSPQVLQFRAVMWGPASGAPQQLPPLPGDSASAATGVNDNGEAVGISGDCDIAVGRFSARHSVLWANGTVTAIPNLGGVTWNTPMAINAMGDVVGFSNPPGPGDPQGDFISHAFLWRNDAAQAEDLGTLSGDLVSEALAINARRQVAGVSFGGAHGLRAFLWEQGIMTDLNTLVGTGNLDVFLSAQDINDAGQITGRVKDHATGQILAFVATPTGRVDLAR
jgi:probable HAF family extracellular repeat protein